MLVILNALLVLAVIIAIFGITNTLALSVFVRAHEIGLLLAVGMSRNQVVRAVSWEAIVVASSGRRSASSSVPPSACRTAQQWHRRDLPCCRSRPGADGTSWSMHRLTWRSMLCIGLVIAGNPCDNRQFPRP